MLERVLVIVPIKDRINLDDVIPTGNHNLHWRGILCAIYPNIDASLFVLS